MLPSNFPTILPSGSPTAAQSVVPSRIPSAVPTAMLSGKPSISPTSSQPTAASTQTPGSSICKKTGGASATNSAGLCSAYKSILSQFNSLIGPGGAYSAGNQTAQANLFGQAVRYSFHDAGEIDIRVSDGMGPDGCLSSSSDNAGLIESTSLIELVMDNIWQSYCDSISRSDFFVLMAKLVVEASSGYKVTIPYQYGRKHNLVCSAGSGRLPSAALGLDEHTRVFVTQMGLDLNSGSILLGAHTLGHVHQANSGYGLNDAAANILTNAWDTTPTVFDNLYFNSLITKAWVNGANPGSTTKNIWKIGNGNIMANTDMVNSFPIDLSTTGTCTACGQLTQVCGGGAGLSCIGPSSTTPVPTLATTQKYQTANAATNLLFLADFSAAFVKMTSVGYPSLTDIDLSTCP